MDGGVMDITYRDANMDMNKIINDEAYRDILIYIKNCRTNGMMNADIEAELKKEFAELLSGMVYVSDRVLDSSINAFDIITTVKKEVDKG
jgi:K+/H+ antiporter YhaU regulatory subunit KhtT